jgi:hypothetical protein
MKETTNKGLRVFLFITVGILLLPAVNAQDPPVDNSKECLFYAFTSSENHNFLIQNNSIVFGQTMKVKHNCEFLEIRSNGEFLARSNNSFEVQIFQGINNLTFQTNSSIQYFKFEVYPDRLGWEYEYNELITEKNEFISINLSNSRENYASIFSIIIVWVLTTYVYWKLIESYTNKNFIEEVVK